ncbi:PAPA-1-like conserved region-domain-containing protein [Whalleya microplaca]|nr:PAPA-1-like conserved region-domain-containing protein [Whalleya microplaca]
MASRPRRAAAQKANTAITDMVDSDNHTNSRTGRTMSSRTSRRSEGKSAAASISRGPPSSPSDSNQHIHVTVKLPTSKLRQATSSRQAARENFVGGEIIEGKRNRSQRKSYVVDVSEDDDDDEGEAEPEVEVEEEDDDEDAEGEDEDMADLGEEDAEGEIIVDDTMDIDGEGEEDDEEDAEGEDDDMVVDPIPPPAPVIKVSKPKSTPSKSKASSKSNAKTAVPQARDSDDDEELSELESEADEIQDTVKVGGGDEDAEGEDEEIEAAEPAGANDDDLDSDGSRAETPDLTKMTKRQRARFEENGDELMKLSDEVQAKKHFTAEELSMRRAEMARRRRNLSEKRNEEVKMETINKLLKKQAPKTNRKSQLADELSPDGEALKPSPIFVRWISTKEGNRVAVPDEMLAGPSGRVFVPGGLKSGKMVEEVS